MKTVRAAIAAAALLALPQLGMPQAGMPGALMAKEPRRVSSAACNAAIAYSEARRGLSVLVLVDGRPVCTGHSKTQDGAHELWSGTKSFNGIIAAAAVQDGLLTLDEKVADTLPEWRDDPLKSKVMIRQLISMTSGQPSRLGRPEGYAASAAGSLAGPPGAEFRYGPTPIQTFGDVMAHKLAQRGLPASPLAYLRARIFAPAGISYTDWRDGPDGNPLLPQGAVMSAAQWAQFGEFVRGGARVDGRAIVDEATFAQLFQGSAANAAYGLTWWLPRKSASTDRVTAGNDLATDPSGVPADMVIAAGAGDQRLYVIPSLHMTIVRQARLNLLAMMAARRGKMGWSDREFLERLGVVKPAG